jgi:iron complex transport system ATP-binding protein
MVLDEPTAFLDLPRRVEIMALLQTLAHTTNKTMLLSTHDLDLALRCADRIWLLPQGGPLQAGAPEDLILNGAFEAAFQSKDVQFDAHTGAFKIHKPQGKTIGLSGQGIIAHWTTRALERIGFKVHTASLSDTQITIINQNGSPTWQITCNGTVEKHHTIYDTLTALKRLQQTVSHP